MQKVIHLCACYKCNIITSGLFTESVIKITQSLLRTMSDDVTQVGTTLIKHSTV